MLSGVSTLPWLIKRGDFNDLLSNEEKKGSVPHPSSLLEGFTRVIVNCELVDLGMIGYLYTWAHRRGADRVEERLDCMFSSGLWQSLFPPCAVFNLISFQPLFYKTVSF